MYASERGDWAEVQSTQVEWSFLDLAQAIWRIRGLLVLGLVVPLLVAATALAMMRLQSFEHVTNYVIEFRFEGLSNDVYPNGLPFSLGDIVAPAVLTSVYESEEVSQYGMSLREFQSAVSITPYAPDRHLIMQKHRLDERRASVAEINEAQHNLQRELASSMRRYAAIRFSSKGFELPQAKIDSILISIVRTWELHAIETRNVLSLDVGMVNPRSFDPAKLDGLDRLNGLRYIRTALDELVTTIDRIAELPGGRVVREAETEIDVAALSAMLNVAALQLAEVPAAWPTSPERIERDSQRLPINVYPAHLFDGDDLQALDYLIALDMVRQRIRLIRDNVQRIVAEPFGDVVRDPQTQLTARDVDRLLFDLEEFSLNQLSAPVLSLGISKDPQVVRLYYNSRLQELRREREALASKARILDQANQSYQGLVGGLAEPVPLGTGAGQGFPSASSSSTVIPQFGDAFIDRLIELTQRGGDTEFRQDLLTQTVELQQQAAEIDAEIARIREYISVFSDQDGQENGADPRLAAQFEETLNEHLSGSMSKLRDYADITTRIAHRLRYAQDIQAIATSEGIDIPVDFYLRTIPDDGQDGRRRILSELQQIAIIANRLYADISHQALGNYKALFSATGQPFLERTPRVGRRELLVLTVVGFLGLTLTFIGGLLYQAMRRPKDM